MPSGTAFFMPAPHRSGLFYTHNFMPISEVYNTDCMEYMRSMPDKFFELAVVDPPYGGANSQIGGGKRFGERFTAISRTGGTWAEKYGKKS